MKAAVLERPRHYVVKEVQTPTPGAGQVLVQVIRCGICGSDIHIFHHPDTPPNVIPGHEWVGRVVQHGPGVTQPEIGARVVLSAYPKKIVAAMPPEMLEGFLANASSALVLHPAVNSGGFGEYLLWDAERLHVVPDAVTDDEAALVDTLAVGVGAAEQGGAGPGKSVLVIGGGAIGLSAVIGSKALGASKIYLSEPLEARRAWALKLGADEALDPTQEGFALEFLRRTGGADVVLDCVGNAATINQSVQLVKNRGRVVLVGMSFAPVTIDIAMWIARNVDYEVFKQTDYPLALRLFEEGGAGNLAGIITSHVPLDEIEKGIALAEDSANNMKVMVDLIT